MTSSMTLGLMVALGAGIAIGLQQIFINITGQMLGPLRSGLAVHMGGTLIGTIMVGFLIMTNPNLKAIEITPKLISSVLIAGVFGMAIVMGVAFSFPRIGQVAGQGSLIMAQMVIAIFADTFALAGGDPLPLDWRRVLGLVVLALGTYLLLPQQSS